jgi:hypothetical protein
MFLEVKNAAQPKWCAQAHCHDGTPMCKCSPFIRPPPPHALHKPPLDTAVELHVDGLTWKNKILMNNPISVRKVDQH